ncbi:MAG: hypothetical protein U0T77_10800 [Chitinophagales bacterium]
MAKTLNEIQQEMLDAKDSVAELSALEVLTTNEQTIVDVDSTSKVSIWRLFVWVVSSAIFVLYQFMDIFRSEIDAKVKANRPHTPDWYKTKALAFQYGDTLVDSDEYAVIDVTKQIIKQVAIEEGDRKIVVKIATLDGDTLVKIDDINKVNAFASYMDDVKDAGTLLEIVNEDADKLKVELEYYYDALLVKDDGTTIIGGVNVVEKAIKDYLNNFEFNGTFDINNLTDYIQKAVGYKSVRLSFVGFKAGLSTSYTAINRQYKPLAGYMKLEELNATYYAVI